MPCSRTLTAPCQVAETPSLETCLTTTLEYSTTFND
jgi:hypothetical protein